MSENEHGEGTEPDDGSNEDFDELQRMLRDFLSGSGMGGAQVGAGGIDPLEFARAAGLPIDEGALQGLFATMQQAMQSPNDGIDWGITRRVAIDIAGQHRLPRASDLADDSDADAEAAPLVADPAPAARAFPVATLWLDEVTDVAQTPDAPRTISRIEWVQQSVDTWVSLAEPVASSISAALVDALESQLPEEMLSGMGVAMGGFGKVLQSVAGALFATQLGQIVGKLSHEVAAGGDIGIPLFEGPGREGGTLLPSGVAAFAEGLEQDAEAVTLYLAVREIAHARLFRQTKWLRLHLITAITDFAQGMRIDADRIEELARDIDTTDQDAIQQLLSSGALIPPKTPEQQAAHTRLENMLALIEGWVDIVTADAVSRLPGADAIAEMVRRRRATGGAAEQAFSTLVGLELRPRRLRDAVALWRLVTDRGGIERRDGLWSHPDLLPTAEELDHPARLLERLGLAGAEPEADVADDFDRELARLLDGDLPPHETDSGSDADDDSDADDGLEADGDREPEQD